MDTNPTEALPSDVARPAARAGPALASRVRRRAVAASILALASVLGPQVIASAVPGATHHTGRTAPVHEPVEASGSGTLGPWQRMGRTRSTPAATRAVAATPAGVLLVGDSIVVGLRVPLTTQLRGRGRPLAWDHWSGRPTHGAVDAVRALAATRSLPRTLVVVSGSNDVFAPSRFPAQLERLMSAAGRHRTVVWVVPDVRRRATAVADTRNSRRIAADLRRAAARHPNLRLVDWPGHLARLPANARARLVPDGVHPSGEGARQLARLTDVALR